MSLINNKSLLHVDLNFLTENRFCTFAPEDISSIIQDPNKAHSHDKISIWMLKLCKSTMSKPVFVIFHDC